MSILGKDPFGTKQRRRNLAREKAQAQVSRTGVESLMSEFGDRASGAYADADQTASQRYGLQIQDARDTVGQNMASTQSGILRNSMAGGPDVSGRAGVSLLGAAQGANEAYGDITKSFEDRNEAASRFDISRGDELTARKTGIATSLMGIDEEKLQAERNRQLQRKQAIAQFGSDLIGTAAKAFGATQGKPPTT